MSRSDRGTANERLLLLRAIAEGEKEMNRDEGHSLESVMRDAEKTLRSE